MAGNRDWGDLDITRDEINTLTECLKQEEFRKLLNEYAEEINNPENKRQYQEDIIQLEAERGVDCTFINPEPGFVVKTSVDGKKKAFINICKNSHIGKPSSKPVTKDNSRGLSWSIPYSQSPGREDHDNKRNRCVVYDVVFHPDTLYLAAKNTQFRNLVVDTALNAVEDAYKVNLDKKNIKFPKLKFKGLVHATVIRRKSEKPVVLSEEDLEFHSKLNYPATNPPLEKDVELAVKDFSNKVQSKVKYTVPNYVIKHRSGIDLEEFTNDKHAKLNTAIPKELVVEVNLPLLNSSNQVTLDVTEKALHLECEKPAKYKLDIQLPYTVREAEGAATFDKDKRILVVTLPVMRSVVKTELAREDSGVESDYGERSNSPEDSLILDVPSYVKPTLFLDADKHYIMPSFMCNVDNNTVCYVLNIKNVDPTSVKQQVKLQSFHIKFSTLGSGFFPICYAFYVELEDACNIHNSFISADVWDNNVTVQFTVSGLHDSTKYFVGLEPGSVQEKAFSEHLDIEQRLEQIQARCEEVFADEATVTVTVATASEDQLSLTIAPEQQPAEKCEPPATRKKPGTLKIRALSESAPDYMPLSPITTKSILKNRMNRSLSESNADDYILPSSVDESNVSGSDSFLEHENGVDEGSLKDKKTVRFNDKIHKQLFRVNSSILGQRKKNQRRTRNKRKAMERRASEGENSEEDGKKSEGTASDSCKEEDEDDDDDEDYCDNTVIKEADEGEMNEFRSDLIFDLDM